jgi:pimeloyl-ACP methyl ester carboxylesterase
MIKTNNFAHLPNDISLHYASCGDPNNPLLLCLHGFPEFWYSWKDLIPELSKKYFVVAPDMRGYNLSSKPESVESYKPKYLVEDINQLIVHLGYEKAVVIAHDWGGAIAWNFAIAHPNRVNQLIILNAPHPYLFAKGLTENPLQQENSQYMNWLRQPGSEDALVKDDFQLLGGFFKRSSKVNWFIGETEQTYKKAWGVPQAVKSSVNWYRASPLHPPEEGNLGAVKLQLKPEDFVVNVPTLVIWGMADDALPPYLIEGLEAFIPKGRVVPVPGASHWLIHEQPELILKEINQFLDSITQVTNQ